MQPFRIKPLGIIKSIVVFALIFFAVFGGFFAFLWVDFKESGMFILLPIGFSMLIFGFAFVSMGRIISRSYIEIQGDEMTIATYDHNRRFATGKVSLGEIERIYRSRCVVSQGRNRTIQYGIYCCRQGRKLYVPLTFYSVAQRNALMDEIARANPRLKLEAEERADDDFLMCNMPLEWLAAQDIASSPNAFGKPTDIVGENVECANRTDAFVQEEAPAQYVAPIAPVERQQTASVEKDATSFRYAPYEDKKPAKCMLCGVKIASVTEVGEHEIAGYVCGKNKPKWVCCACWDRYREQKGWQEE